MKGDLTSEENSSKPVFPRTKYLIKCSGVSAVKASVSVTGSSKGWGDTLDHHARETQRPEEESFAETCGKREHTTLRGRSVCV